MKKSLSRNPNMLRTMIGLGMTLILLLGYAVYSNTLDSEYYRFETTNEEVVLTTVELDDDGTCKSCGADEGDHIGESKICPVIQYFSPFS